MLSTRSSHFHVCFDYFVCIRISLLIIVGFSPTWVQASPSDITPTQANQLHSECSVPIAEIKELVGSIQAGGAAEWLPARDVVMHTPGEEIFLGVIHPDAALFEVRQTESARLIRICSRRKA